MLTPMKVLLLSDWYAPAVNGVVSSVKSLRRGLETQGHDVRVLATGSERATTFDGDVYRIASVGVGALYPMARLGKPLDRGVLESVLDWAPDVVHSHTEFVAFMWARRFADYLDVPHVHTYHTVYEDYTHYFSPSRTVGRAVAAQLTRRVLGGTDLVVVPTAKVEKLLRTYRLPLPIRVIPTGVDLDRFTCETLLRHGGSGGRAQLRRRLGIPPHTPVILFVGRLAHEKNLAETFRLIARMRQFDWRFVVVGDGPWASHARHSAAAHGIAERVVFTGAVDPESVSDYYRIGDVFVSSSRSETQGLTYIEALASGVPVLCRSDPVLDGVVVDDVNGYQYTSAHRFNAHMAELLTDKRLRTRLAEGARAGAMRFSEQGFAESVARAYAESIEMAARRRRPWMGRAA